jgi:hypothetical protein
MKIVYSDYPKWAFSTIWTGENRAGAAIVIKEYLPETAVVPSVTDLASI